MFWFVIYWFLGRDEFLFCCRWFGICYVLWCLCWLLNWLWYLLLRLSGDIVLLFNVYIFERVVLLLCVGKDEMVCCELSELWLGFWVFRLLCVLGYLFLYYGYGLCLVEFCEVVFWLLSSLLYFGLDGFCGVMN